MWGKKSSQQGKENWIIQTFDTDIINGFTSPYTILAALHIGSVEKDYYKYVTKPVLIWLLSYSNYTYIHTYIQKRFVAIFVLFELGNVNRKKKNGILVCFYMNLKFLCHCLC